MPDDVRTRRLKGLRPMVGDTPLLTVRLRYRGRECRVHAKAEYLNLTGSIKDRMAFHICKTAIEQGVLAVGDTIVEATSGNTGIAFSALGAALGHPVVIFMPDWMSEERKAVIRSFGADIRLVSREAGGFLGSIESAETLARDLGRVCSCPASSTIRPTCRPTPRPRARNSSPSSPGSASRPTPSWPGSAPGAP